MNNEQSESQQREEMIRRLMPLSQGPSIPSVQDYAQDRKRVQNVSWPYGSTNETHFGGVQGDPNPATALFPNVDIGLDDVGMLAASVAPGSGDVIAAQDSMKYARQAENARKEGRYLDMPGLYAESIASGFGAVPLFGGMARALKGGVNKAVGAYRSRLEPALENMPQEKMTADQARGYLSKVKGGVSSDELDYTGINAMLKSGQPVTKTGLLDQYNANPLQINDVYKGGRINTEPLTESEAVRKEYLRDLDIHEGRAMTDAEHQEFRNLAVRSNGGERLGEPTKFSDYTLPGGENYRELLMTLPPSYSHMNKLDDALAKESKILDALEAQGVKETDPRWIEAERRFAEAERSQKAGAAKMQSQQDYTSGHYDEPNILAHARYNTRNIDGDKTLFIEEIQSDWHQAGRKKGYNQDVTAVDAAIANKKAEIEGINVERDSAMPAYNLSEINSIDDLPGHTNQESSLYDRYLAANEELKLLLGERASLGAGVPDAPYKATDKWQGLAFRRTVKEAIDQGHDRIAWTPGAVQADRYDLSKQVKMVTYNEKTGDFHAWTPSNTSRSIRDADIIEKNVSPDKLSELVGKDVAEKMMRGEAGATGGRILEGKDLKVGGEGMKSFYDKMMVKTANKFGKKYGAKVEVKEMGTSADIRYSDYNDKWYHYDDGVIDRSKNWDTEDAAKKALNQEVWTIKITPEMKKDLIKGGVALGAAGVMLPGGQE